VDWVVFDYGEVISTRTTALPDLARLVGAAPAEFETAYWRHRDAYDRGCPDVEFWRAIGRDLGIAVNRSTSDDLTELDIAGWSQTDPSTLRLLADLNNAGVPLALLSNAPVSFARFAEKQRWAAYFRERVFSGDVGVTKPDPRIFRTLVDRVGAQPQDCLFLDDRQGNVDGARSAGLRAECWLGADSAQELLFAAPRL
jgi:putative hydrolase of the HAD superfamily